MSLLRIRIQAPPDAGTARSAGKSAGDSYVERLLKLIPAEAIGIYLVGVQVVGGDIRTLPGLARWTLACTIFVIVLRAILSSESPKFGLDNAKSFGEWWRQFRRDAQWPAVFIATISFLVWATALGHPVAPWFSSQWNACDTADAVICGGEKLGTLILLLWTPLAAFLYTGERAGNLTNDGRDLLDKQPRDPSPTTSRPDPIAQRRVISPDHRTKPSSLKRSPYESIALLHAFRPNQTKAAKLGTGWLVSSSSIVTAGHVLTDMAWIRGWLRYDSDADDWGAFFESSQLIVHSRYVNNSDESFDIGIIKLREEVLNAASLKIKDPAASPSTDFRCAGYPEDKGGLTMYEASGEPKGQAGTLVFHNIDTDDGQSGSPIWFGIGREVTAVHTGHGSADNSELNHGIYMNAEIVSWIKEHLD
ncbi:trypsin-like serine peptidase [Lentisalinibacter salinarum]|uniref:trypsin-like serine peptidase n=1 Tax=Lentisalinibacter salinarum TaxID=2992239 RepID=UPI00386A68BF